MPAGPCPNCGAPFTFAETTRVAYCEHCGKRHTRKRTVD